MNPVANTTLHSVALFSLSALIAFCLIWEIWLTPIGHGRLAFKVLPLLIALPGVWQGRLYTLQWASMMILLFFTEGVVRATSDHGVSAWLAAGEVVLTVVFFWCAIFYVRPFKKAAVALRRTNEGQ